MARLALLIGVSEYGDGLNPLPSSVLDVDALQQVLLNPEMGGFAATDIRVLKNPQRQAMEDSIYWLFNDRKKDDLLLFYFSGHGVKDEYSNLYLSTAATRKENGKFFEPSAVPATSIHQRINTSASQHQVLILDCCFSGAIAKGMTVKDDGSVDLQQHLGGKGRAILTSSTATEYSFAAEAAESGSSGLSIYTNYLVEGIRTGAADLDDDGLIAVEELHEYASKRVKEAAPAMNPKFYPVEEGYKIILAKSPQDDPKLKYRKEVERRAEPPLGKISIFAERLLERKRCEWGISAADAGAIRAEVLQPYREYQHKLQEYEEALSEAVESEYPFRLVVEGDLKDYQQYLRLRDEDIAEIHQRVLPAIAPPVITALQIPTEDEIRLTKIQFTSVKLNARGEISARSQRETDGFVEDLGNGVSLTMVKIPAGKFMMGSPDSEIDRSDRESPQHQVSIPAFYIGQTLVTQAQWQVMMGNNPSHFTGDDKLPVEQVSWFDCMDFCQQLTDRLGKIYRLPSEAEWEYAARAGTTTPFHFGDTIDAKVANYCARDRTIGKTSYSGKYGQGQLGTYREQTTPVGDFGVANDFGLYDLHGNLWEWCLDEWVNNYNGAPTDGSPRGNISRDSSVSSRILRGGSWYNIPRICRSATRNDYSPDNRSSNFGFRVVCETPRTV